MWALGKAINVVTDTIGELVHSEENLRQSANDLGSELSNNSSDIEGYKKKIEELKSILNDSSLSFDEVSQARIGLMAIQDELIEKFGTEKGVIESITSAINNQIASLDLTFTKNLTIMPLYPEIKVTWTKQQTNTPKRYNQLSIWQWVIMTRILQIILRQCIQKCCKCLANGSLRLTLKRI